MKESNISCIWIDEVVEFELELLEVIPEPKLTVRKFERIRVLNSNINPVNGKLTDRKINYLRKINYCAREGRK
jgi:hypothetical protein